MSHGRSNEISLLNQSIEGCEGERERGGEEEGEKGRVRDGERV